MKFFKRFLGSDGPTSTADLHSSRNGRDVTNVHPSDERSYRSGRQQAHSAQPQVVVDGRVQWAGSTARFDHSAVSYRVTDAPGGAKHTAAAAPAQATPPPAATHGSVAASGVSTLVQPHGQRPSSLPQPLVQTGRPLRGTGSGQHAPVSTPDQAAPPPGLRRDSSTACPTGQSPISTVSRHSSSGGEENPAIRAGAAGLQTARRRDGGATAPVGFTAAPQLAAGMPAAVPQPRGGLVSVAQQEGGWCSSPSPPPDLRWQPEWAALPADHATPGWARSMASHEQAGGLPPGPLTTTALPPAPSGRLLAIPAGGAAEGGSPTGPDAPQPGSSLGSVSLLTCQLKGRSAASSVAPSRESSVRNGIKRQPGGLTLALSRENSVRGGARDREASVRSERERSVRDGSSRGCAPRDGSSRGFAPRDGSSRGMSLRGAGGRQDGSVLAQWGVSAFGGVAAAAAAPAGLQAAHAPQLVGCGSGDWMGLAVVPEQLPPDDPFAALAPAPAAPRLPTHSEHEELELDPEQPQDVGSWAQRVTTFPRRPDAAAAAGRQNAGGPDPLLLTAALQVLAADGSGPPGSSPASGTAAGCDVLVGDSDLALAGSGEMHTLAPGPGERRPSDGTSLRPLPLLSGGSSAPVAAAATSYSSVAAAALSSSWDAGCGAAALPPVPLLGGSAPTRGLGAPSTSLRWPGSLPHNRLDMQAPTPGEVTAAAQEWNRSFMKRWRAVKQRAYLQGLGLRALWRVNSPGDRHEPLELLTNDLPQHDNGMRRAWSVSLLAGLADGGGQRGATSAARPMERGAAGHALHKDPSLHTLLLGEVAEVC